MRRSQGSGAIWRYEGRELQDTLSDDGGEPGYLYVSDEQPWPDDPYDALERLPDAWLEDVGGSLKIKAGQRKNLPTPVTVGPDGVEAGSGLRAWWMRAPFRFCLSCGIAHQARSRSDYGKLSGLGTEGRSTATTTLALTAIRGLREDDDPTLAPEARKLLSFTDNRQDASLQAGHFNDFIQVVQLRAALYAAATGAGPDGLTHDVLAQRVVEALGLDLAEYAENPRAEFAARGRVDRALRDVTAYRLYVDLRHGWRLTSPNLEQTGLLRIDYESLPELCASERHWAQRPDGRPIHGALVAATPTQREEVARTLLDHLRQQLAIKVDYLEESFRESLRQTSSQELVAPWAADVNELDITSVVAYPRSRTAADYRGPVFLSARSGFGQYVRRHGVLPTPVDVAGAQQVIIDLLEVLTVAGLVEPVRPPRDEGDVAGYQLPASAMRWLPADGATPYRDRLRIPSTRGAGPRVNPYFRELYRTTAGALRGMAGREHTAQVPADVREEREEQFRAGTLPVLFCSPTMELGVDIAQLNVVNLRNVPPTPANYAQRSGRAGRSGQPALVYTYCTTGSSHDQYFFRRADRMVAGAVSPPRLDLANADLLTSHIHALWLAETGLDLGRSLRDVLDLGDIDRLPLLESVQAATADPGARRRARERAARLLADLGEELAAAPWWHDGWLDDVLGALPTAFDRACDRWRDLYRGAQQQFEAQNRIIKDHSASPAARQAARRVRREAEAQMDLLTADTERIAQSDFSSYRYFASEGFLPGYSFPRLPLSAFIPGERGGRDDYLSRPRFLAVSEFGPQAFVYHEGAVYQVRKVQLPARDVEAEGGLLTTTAKVCQACGELHDYRGTAGPDVCRRCSAALPAPMANLFRMTNVTAQRRRRISSDEEERTRYGYDVRTALRFGVIDGVTSAASARAVLADRTVAVLTYGDTATIWRVNYGWRRRKEHEPPGFVLDIDRGTWARNQQADDDEQLPDEVMRRTQRVVPYVEDRRNALLMELPEVIDADAAAQHVGAVLASAGSAVKRAIQARYQLEDTELAAEVLPSFDEPRVLLFYEASEGGAGVLRRLVRDPSALSEVAREALRICHVGDDAPQPDEPCTAACYDCLMSYGNQRVHRSLDRQLVIPLLQDLASARVVTSPTPAPRADHLARLRRLSTYTSEQQWLDFVEEHGLRLPDGAQERIADVGACPDFVYRDAMVAVFVDGGVHGLADVAELDGATEDRLMDAGWTVARFRTRDRDLWASTASALSGVFGTPTQRRDAPPQ